MDYPRYSSGYTTLWNTLGMMVETHMLKPYDKRVEGTYVLMHRMISIIEKDGRDIRFMRDNSRNSYNEGNYYPVGWQLDTTRVSKFLFKGFKADTLISKVTGAPRLKFNRDMPIENEVTYQNYFKASDSVKIPKAYVIGKQWQNVIKRLDLNHITYSTLKNDTIITVEAYKIADYQTVSTPYEGHYLHYNTSLNSVETNVNFHSGDIVIPTNQPGVRYIIETLEPASVDSFFNWNFFDTILQQKEGFSPYVFEDTALLMLENDSVLKNKFLNKKKLDTNFNSNWYLQLDWLFKQSNLYEKAHLQYPIYRIINSN
jgi:hypothetical protein